MIEIEDIEFPESWVVAKLSDMVIDPKRDFVDGPFGSNLKASEYQEQGVPVFRIQNIKPGYFLDKNIQFVTEDKAEELKRHSFKLGDVIITKLGEPLGLCCKVPSQYPRGIIVADLMRVSPSDLVVNTDYLVYAINSKIIQDQFKRITKGTTRARVNLTIVRDVQIPLAPLNEQNRITEKLDELLSELEKGKEQLQYALEQLKVYRQSVLKSAFEGKLTNDENIRWGTLEEVIDGVEYGSAAKSRKTGKVPVLRMGNIQNGKFNWDDLVYTSDDDEINKYHLRAGDVLFNRTNSPELVGKTAIYRGEIPAIFAGYLIRINFSKDELDPDYLNYFLNSQIAKNHGNQVKSFGVNQANINGTKLKQYPFPICSLDLQKKIALEIDSRLSACEKMEADINAAIKQSETLKQAVLQKAFEGKLVKQNAGDEPAIVLLERIKKERAEYLKSEKDQKTLKSPIEMAKGKKSKTDPKLIESIMKDFGRKTFTFDQLRAKVNLPYDDLKDEIFTMLDNSKSLKAEFDAKDEQMKFKYTGK